MTRLAWSRKRGARVPETMRFFAKVTVRGNCAEWDGARVSKGYGSFRRSDGTTASAHRWIWERFYGPIPTGLEVDHLCANRACVRLDHLELVTHAENVRRGKHNQNHGKTHCKYGHPFEGKNLAINSLGKRVCRTCARERQAAYRAEQKAKP